MTKPPPTLLELPFRFPLAVIDFEASALTRESFPIEVGIAIAVNPSASIMTWSSLVAPAPRWDLASQWDPDAERIHGISRWSLRQGKAPRETMLMLNDLLGSVQHIWCDGGHYDVRWLNVLAEAAGVYPVVELRDIGTALRAHDEVSARYREALEQSRAPHRAGPDAERICVALMSFVAQ